MYQQIFDILTSAYTQVIILFFLIAYFFSHRRDPRLVASKLSLIRTALQLLIFFYFLWNWSSEIPPSLRNTSVLGMFLVNLFLFKNVVLTRWERPYRDALEAYTENPAKEGSLDKVWRLGKRFYYARYVITALFSGHSPKHFLHGVATEGICDDLKEILASSGKAEPLVAFKELIAFLEARLERDKSLKEEVKLVIKEDVDRFAQHTWIEAQVKDFLGEVIESPERLHHRKLCKSLEEGRKSSGPRVFERSIR